MKNSSSLGKFLFTVYFLSNFLYAAEEAAENALTASSFPLITPQIDELLEEERSWFDRLNAEKIISLNGKTWEKRHAEIISYRSLYEAIYLLQEQPEDFQGALEISLNEAFLPDFAGKYYALGLFYQMINRNIEGFRAFHRAAELEDELSQKLIVDALCKGELSQDGKPVEGLYRELFSLAESGWGSDPKKNGTKS